MPIKLVHKLNYEHHIRKLKNRLVQLHRKPIMGLRWAGPNNIGLCPAPQLKKDEKQYVEDAMTNKKMDVIATSKRKSKHNE